MIDNVIFTAAAVVFGARTIVYALTVIKEKNYSGGAGLFGLSALVFAAAAVSVSEFFV